MRVKGRSGCDTKRSWKRPCRGGWQLGTYHEHKMRRERDKCIRAHRICSGSGSRNSPSTRDRSNTFPQGYRQTERNAVERGIQP